MSSQIFEAYQIVGAEHQNRLLAIVRSDASTALFSFNVSNYPPINLSDLHIDKVLPINESFLIDSSSGFGVSSYQFQIFSGTDQILYYYYPDSDTCASKDSFERLLRRLIQEYSPDKHGDFEWVEAYKSDDLAYIDISTANNKQPPKNRESKFKEELERRQPEYTIHEPYKVKFIPTTASTH